tara:strand:+ start:1212 stop:2060 length:849 start_codon:yes stop_codon:yes gene_type:complete
MSAVLKTTISRSKSAYAPLDTIMGEMEIVPLSRLFVEIAYQREFKGKHAMRLAKEWDWNCFKPLSIIVRKNKYYVTDGQHSLGAALLRGDIDVLPCYVTYADDDIRSEADAFLKINRNRKSVTPFSAHKAALLAEDAEALVVQRTVDAQGYGISNGGGSEPYKIRAVSACYRLSKTGVLSDVLIVIDGAWGGRPEMLRSVVLDGVGQFIGRAVRVLEDDYSPTAVTKKICKYGAEKLLSDIQKHERSNIAETPVLAVSVALAKAYDKHSRGAKITPTLLADL